MEELIGKSDEAVQTLSVDSQQQLDQWLEWIGLACSLDRRKGSLSVIESLRTLESKDEGSNTSLGPRKSLLSTMFPQIESECIDNSQPLLNSEVFAVSEATQGGSKEMFPVDIPNPVELELAVSVSDSSVVPQTDAESADAPQTTTAAESEMILPSLGRPAKPLARKPSRTFMPPVVVDSASEGDLVTVSAAPLVDPEFSPDGKNLAEKLEAKLEARRKVFKPPNFKNLLNSNGFYTIVRKSHAGSETGSETDTTPPSRSTAAGTPIPAEQQHGGVGIASARRSHSPNHTAPHSSNARRHGHGHGLGQDQQGHGNRGGGGIIEGADSSHASSAAPSPFPNTEHHNVEASPATPLLQPGDALAPRRSFSKSPARRRTSKKATHQEGASTLTAGTVEGHDTANSSRAHTPSPTPPSTSHAPLTRHLKISVRPTEAVRMGYLYRLDTSPSHDSSMGSDVWLTQFVSMDITTGMMHVYAEING